MGVSPVRYAVDVDNVGDRGRRWMRVNILLMDIEEVLCSFLGIMDAERLSSDI
jgi:hypothetical protein